MKKWNKPEMMDLDTKCTADIMPLSGTGSGDIITYGTCPRCNKVMITPNLHDPQNHQNDPILGGACILKKNCPDDCPVHHS